MWLEISRKSLWSRWNFVGERTLQSQPRIVSTRIEDLPGGWAFVYLIDSFQEFGRNFCEKKGLTSVLALAKNVKGGTEADVRKMATELRQAWALDQQCMKGLVIVVSIEDKKFWVSRDSKVPVYAGEFSEILNGQVIK